MGNLMLKGSFRDYLVKNNLLFFFFFKLVDINEFQVNELLSCNVG